MRADHSCHVRRQHITRHLGQTEYVVEFAVCRQSRRTSPRTHETGASSGGQNPAEQHPIPIHPLGAPRPPRSIQGKMLIAISNAQAAPKLSALSGECGQNPSTSVRRMLRLMPTKANSYPASPTSRQRWGSGSILLEGIDVILTAAQVTTTKYRSSITNGILAPRFCGGINHGSGEHVQIVLVSRQPPMDAREKEAQLKTSHPRPCRSGPRGRTSTVDRE